MEDDLHQTIDRALDGATASLEDIAREAGVSYDTLYAWKTARRNPTKENLRRLAKALLSRSGELRAFGEALERAAGEKGDTG